MVRSARRRLISFLPLSVTVQERPCGGVNCHFTRRYGDLEARDSNFRSKNVGRCAVYSLLPADWKTLWRYQHVSTGMLDDNGWGLMFEILSPFAQRKRWNRVNGFKFFLPFPFFRLSSIPFTRMDKTRIRSFFVSLERRRLGEPSTVSSIHSVYRASRPRFCPSFRRFSSLYIVYIHNPGGRRITDAISRPSSTK